MDQFIRQDIFQIILYPCFFVFLIFMAVLSDKQVTRVTVFFWGLTLIALAGYVAYSLMAWRVTAELLTHPETPLNKRVSEDAFRQYDRMANYLLWFVPFLTGALGTNLISDALTKPLDYKTPFSISGLVVTIIEGIKMLLQLALLILFLPFLLMAITISAINSLKNCPRKWRIYGKLYNRAYVRRHRKAKQPWEL